MKLPDNPAGQKGIPSSFADCSSGGSGTARAWAGVDVDHRVTGQGGGLETGIGQRVHGKISLPQSDPPTRLRPRRRHEPRPLSTWPDNPVSQPTRSPPNFDHPAFPRPVPLVAALFQRAPRRQVLAWLFIAALRVGPGWVVTPRPANLRWRPTAGTMSSCRERGRVAWPIRGRHFYPFLLPRPEEDYPGRI